MHLFHPPKKNQSSAISAQAFHIMYHSISSWRPTDSLLSLLNGHFQFLEILYLQTRCYMISTAFSSLKGLIVSVKSDCQIILGKTKVGALICKQYLKLNSCTFFPFSSFLLHFRCVGFDLCVVFFFCQLISALSVWSRLHLTSQCFFEM